MPPSHRGPRRQPTLIERNRSTIIIAVIVFAAAALVVGGFVLSSSGGGTSTASEADPALVQSITGLAPSVFNAVGAGSASNPPASISAPALTSNGKPEVLYVGGEFCPYCAAERWAMVLALSRFGTFSGLKTTRSASADVYANTPTFSFYGSSFQSDYIAFVPVEQYSNQRDASGYTLLQPLTDDQRKIVDAYDPGGIPFIDFGGKYALSGASYNPGLLSGLDWAAIAARLTQTTTPQSQAIVGTANVLTAAICKITNAKPDNVCNSAGVQSAMGLVK
ncbi:MAG TPA: DUF929 family protein [Dehalococcoidia bacterium]